jgi:MoaA/NifB/PqqE/SkfB family radical SAM enzyme
LNRDIALENFKIGFPLEEMKSIEMFLFCGSVGDPIYTKDLLRIIQYIKSAENIPAIHIITNGSYKPIQWWGDLGGLLSEQDTVTFSVDGWDQSSNNNYRVNSNFSSITDGIVELRSKSHCKIVWSTIFFNFNQTYITRIKDLAISLGCDEFRTVKSSKFEPLDLPDHLRPDSSLISSGPLMDRESYIISSRRFPAMTRSTNTSHPWAKCLRGEKEIFVDSTGAVMPCSWFQTGYFKDTPSLNFSSIQNQSLHDILSSEGWESFEHLLDSTPPQICVYKCKGCSSGK